jgi:MFS family permease
MSIFQGIGKMRILLPLKSRDFRLLFVGQGVSLFGDQFYLVALPLLTLELTGSGVALGSVLMIGGISRAAFDLMGGALTDRVSNRSILLTSNLVRALVTATITALSFLRVAELWHLYLLSLVFGVVDAFFFPAFLSLIPRLIDKDQLNAGNALMRGTARMMGGIGPAVAGLVITSFSIAKPAANSSLASATTDGRRFAASFLIDTCTFVFAAITVWLMRERHTTDTGNLATPRLRGQGFKSLLRSIRDGLSYALRDPLIRALLLFTAVIEFSFIGPSTVGLAILAKTRFPGGDPNSQGAGAYAAMLSSFGFGMLAGMLLAGSIKMPRFRGRTLISIVLLLAMSIAALGFVGKVWEGCALVSLIGLGGGLANIMLLAWIQSRADAGMLGRVLSLVMFGTSLVEPLSYGLAGLVADVNLKAVFVASGAIMLAGALFSSFNRAIVNSE